MKGLTRSTRVRALAVTACLAGVALVAAGSAPPSAQAAFGDDFRVIDSFNAPAFQPGSGYAYWAGTCDIADRVSDAGSSLVTPPAAPTHCIDPGVLNGGTPIDPPPTTEYPWTATGAPSWRLAPVTQAGAHPDATTTFTFARDMNRIGGVMGPAGDLKDASVDLPPGFVGGPTAVPQCTAAQFRSVPPECPAASQVGVVQISLSELPAVNTYLFPVYNLEPRRGRAAEFGADVRASIAAPIRFVGEVRTGADSGITVSADQLPSGYGALSSTFTIWGVPWDPSHDRWRTPTGTPIIPMTGVTAPQSYDPSWGPVRSLISNPTECSGQSPVTRLWIDSWEKPGQGSPLTNPDDPNWLDYDSAAPPVTGCNVVPFDPAVEMRPSSSAADSASGLSVDIDVPQSDDPDILATSHLKDTVVILPEGLSVNPSGATGLEGCSDAQVGLRGIDFPAPAPARFTDDDPFDGQGTECPDGSKIGTVEVTTPLLDERLTGDVVLGEPKSTDPQSGEMFRLFLVIRNKERGLLVKVFGSAVADPQTGRLTATFKSNPQLPFSDLDVDLKGGDRGVLATPPRCNTAPDQYRSVSTLLPWSRAHLALEDQDPVAIDQDWTIDGDCDYGFDPGLVAGMSNSGARQGGAFSFEFTRPQGDQWLRGLTAQLPKGLLAAVKDVPLCADAQAAAGDCPAASRIGLVDASAGSGDPFVLEQKGDVYLTEGYKGGPYGLMVKIRAVAGPFRGAMELDPIVVRQKVEVDRSTAQVRAVSDPFPTVWHGVPLRVRRVLVSVDRPGFMVNPSSCSAKEVRASLTSTEGTTAERANLFQATGCAGLPFKPSIALQAIGRNQVRTGTHPGIKAIVRQAGVGEAGIAKAVVRLPKSLALDPDNAQALCEYTDGIKDDLENHCPAGSMVGRARAKTPLLRNDLVGNVYFVKNVRKDPKTGNLIRTLPMIVVALRGEIAINLKGESSTTSGGKLVNTFNDVPDAPITQFNLNIKGGPNGILAVTRTRKAKINLCATRQIAEADTDSHNSRRHDFDIRIQTPCTKAQVKKAKRAAKKAAKGKR